MSKEPRPLTQKELTDLFLQRVKEIAGHWSQANHGKSTREKIEGALESLLTSLDGLSSTLPPFKLVANNYDEDLDYRKKTGQDWVDPGTTLESGLAARWARARHDYPKDVVLQEAFIWKCPRCGCGNAASRVPAELSEQEELDVRELVDIEPGQSVQGMFSTAPSFVVCQKCCEEFNVSSVSLD